MSLPEIHVLHHGRNLRPDHPSWITCLKRASDRYRFIVHAEKGGAFALLGVARGFETHEYRVPSAWRPRALRAFRDAIAERVGPEGRLVLTISSAIGWTAAKVARRFRLPHLWRLEDDCRRNLRHALLRRVAHGYLASSRAVLEQAGIPAGHPFARVVPHGITARNFELDRPPVVSTPMVTVGMYGGFETRAGHHLFLEMARAVAKKRPNTQFLVAGEIGPDAGKRGRQYADLLGDLVRGWGLEGRVHFVMPPLLRDFVDRLDLFVVPATRDGASYPATFAMARGVPVLATRVGPFPELIRSGECGWLVPPKDVRALIQACRFLTGNPHIARRLGARGRRSVERAHTLEDVSQKMCAVFDEFLSSPDGPPLALAEEATRDLGEPR